MKVKKRRRIKRVRRRRRINFNNVLCFDVLREIFSFLTFEELYRFKRVCKSWKGIVEKAVENTKYFTITCVRQDEGQWTGTYGMSVVLIPYFEKVNEIARKLIIPINPTRTFDRDDIENQFFMLTNCLYNMNEFKTIKKILLQQEQVLPVIIDNIGICDKQRLQKNVLFFCKEEYNDCDTIDFFNDLFHYILFEGE